MQKTPIYFIDDCDLLLTQSQSNFLVHFLDKDSVLNRQLTLNEMDLGLLQGGPKAETALVKA